MMEESVFGSVATRALLHNIGQLVDKFTVTTIDLTNFMRDSITGFFVNDLAACPHIKELKLLVDEAFFAAVRAKHPCEEEFDEANLIRPASLSGCRLRRPGLRTWQRCWVRARNSESSSVPG